MYGKTVDLVGQMPLMLAGRCQMTVGHYHVKATLTFNLSVMVSCRWTHFIMTHSCHIWFIIKCVVHVLLC